jgi:uncharacterized membrane protein
MTNEKDVEEDRLRILGTILELLGVPILVIVAVLWNLPNKDLGTISVLFIIGVLLFFIGLMLSHLPSQKLKRGIRPQIKKSVLAVSIIACMLLCR